METTAFRDRIFGTADGASLTAWSPFAGFIKSITDWRAGTVVEATYTGYASRKAISYGAPANTNPVGGRQVANDAVITFDKNTGVAEDQIAVGVWDSATIGAGELKYIGAIDDDPPIIGTADIGDLITAPAHGLVADQRVLVMASPGALLPAGLAENTFYFVLAVGLTADAFKVSATSGGAAIDITAAGAGMFISYKVLTVATNATPEIAIGAHVWQR